MLQNRRRLARNVFLILLLIPAITHAWPEAEDIHTLAVAEIPVIRTLDGTVEAVHQATVSAQVSGRIEKLFFDVDDYVKKDELLIQFRDKNAQAELKAAQASLKEAETEYQRMKEVFARKLVAQAALDKAEARYKSAQAAMEQARENLSNTQVRAPYSGIVVKRHIEEGELARPGQPLMTGLSLEALRVQVHVPQNMIHHVRARQKAYLVLSNQQQVAVESMTISSQADSQTRSFQVRCQLPKEDFGLYPGMMVKTAFVTGLQQGLLVPERAIARRSEVTAVYVIDDKEQVTFRHLRLGKVIAEHNAVEALSGLNEGERILLDPVKAAALYHQQRKQP